MRMPFDPERDGWPLNHAIMRLSDPGALAALARFCSAAAEKDGRPRLPPWWLEAIGPSVAGSGPTIDDLDRQIYQQCRVIERALVDQLVSGDLLAWARPNSPMARYERVPVDAWRRLGDCVSPWVWRDGTLLVEEVTRHEVVSRQANEPVRQRDRSLDPLFWLRFPGRRLQPVREVVLRLYAVRIQPPDGLVRVGKSASEAECRAWLAELMKAQPDKPRSKAALQEEARQRFGLGTEAFKRAWTSASAETGSPWSKPGRRKSSG
jgi:hypothetical protein